MSDRGWHKGPLMTETVEGDPIYAEGRELTPFVEVTGRVRRQASITNAGVSGHGWGFIQLRPVAILDRSEDGGQHLTIPDQTPLSIKRLLLVAIVVPCVAAILITLSRKLH
jgi:hypothetical protein